MITVTKQSLQSHMEQKIHLTDLQSKPFPYFFIENIFPNELYAHIQRHTPGRDRFKKSDPKRTSNPQSINHRVRINMTDNIQNNDLNDHEVQLWRFISKTIGSQEFSTIIKHVFREGLEKRYGSNTIETKTRIELISDQNGYSISPHTDGAHKVATLLFYMPKDSEQIEYGTSIYQPNDNSFTDERGLQLPFEMFQPVRQFPFAPNSVLGFIKTNNSFHGRPGIKQLNQPRNWMNCSIQHSKATSV